MYLGPDIINVVPFYRSAKNALKSVLSNLLSVVKVNFKPRRDQTGIRRGLFRAPTPINTAEKGRFEEILLYIKCLL